MIWRSWFKAINLRKLLNILDNRNNNNIWLWNWQQNIILQILTWRQSKPKFLEKCPLKTHLLKTHFSPLTTGHPACRLSLNTLIKHYYNKRYAIAVAGRKTKCERITEWKYRLLSWACGQLKTIMINFPLIIKNGSRSHWFQSMISW